MFREALKLCSSRLVVGVTDINMIKNKFLWELIAPINDRIKGVRDHLTSVNPDLEYQVVAINDIYGPTIQEEDLDCIVVSKETVRGAEKINEARSQKGWRELRVHVVDLLQEKDPSLDEAMNRLHEKKVSSSIMRLDKLGTILKPPIPKPHLPKRPYLIGLTGGVASGKSALGEYLKSVGFGYISYDLMGHMTYATRDSPTYKDIVEYFGISILNEETQLIDRSKLGAAVFGDRSKLDKLNQIVWPAIYLLVDEEIARLKDKHDVIVLESALLVESGQTDRVHQIWTMIIPPEEAVKRQMASRGISKEEAEKRVNSQVDNFTRVQAANVVFCSLWEIDFTRKQANKCINELRRYYLNDN